MSENLQQCKLLISIVNHGMARKVVKASKEAGAESGTTLMGRGTGSRKIKTIFSIPVEPEKEIILTLTNEEKLDSILQAMITSGKLDKPGYGVAFLIDLKKVAGISHLGIATEANNKGMERMKMENSGDILYDLIVTIVNKGDSEKVVESSKKAGAEGGTILFGRGTGIHEQAKLFGITIEPEKEIVLTLIPRQYSQQVLEAIISETKLNEPGKGIAFVLEVERVAGINHLLNKMINTKLSKNRQ